MSFRKSKQSSEHRKVLVQKMAVMLIIQALIFLAFAWVDPVFKVSLFWFMVIAMGVTVAITVLVHLHNIKVDVTAQQRQVVDK
ncbi:hypothetical protein GF325_16035 [Candidatus Bathyarchaeota archaeon]|nr:hypothetical protein [Candidatus Bathyarchaeota archaeon]